MASTGFLKFNSRPPRIYVTADDNEFDPVLLRNFQEEGFTTSYLPLSNGGKSYLNRLRHLSDDLELGEHYAVVAFGDAASACLEYFIKPAPHCCALVAYYPTTIAKPNTAYPSQLEVLCHVAATQGFAPAFRSYTYPETKPGFAEDDLMEYDRVGASLSWTRTLGTLRKAFKLEVDLETVVETYHATKFVTKEAPKTMRTMTEDPYVTFVPTMTGGIGQKDLFVFYRDYFMPGNPPGFHMRLISRTIGVDRVVDEISVSFKHTQEMPWILPDVPPTNKAVRVVLVSIVCIRGGKLYHEHVYWDQASVLVQVGLLDPKLVPGSMKKQGLKQLPVIGAQSVSKVLDEHSSSSNELISGWKPVHGDPGALPSRPKQTANGK